MVDLRRDATGPRANALALFNIVFDGNSLVYGNVPESGLTMPQQVMATRPLRDSGATYANLGISGQTWTNMASAATDVDGAWTAGRRNLLVLWEHTNQVFNAGATAQQTIDAAVAYMAARQAAHAWEIILLTTLPRTEAPGGPSNPKLVQVDDYFRANFASLGISLMVDVRAPGSPFDFSGDSDAGFVTFAPYWQADKVHLTPLGYGYVANLVARAIATRLPYRPGV